MGNFFLIIRFSWSHLLCINFIINYRLVHSIFKLYVCALRTLERRILRFMIFMTSIVVKKVSENKKNIDNHIRFFLYEKFKESDYIGNHKI